MRLTRFLDDVMRTPGVWKGLIEIPADFDEIDEDIIRDFEGSDDDELFN